MPVTATRAEAPEAAISTRIEGHQIAFKYLVNDDFDGFFDARSQALLDIVADAMGKAIARGPAGQVPAVDDYELDEEELTEAETEGATA